MFSNIVRSVVQFARTQIVPMNHGILAAAQIHMSSTLNEKTDGPKKWPAYNKKLFPPQTPDEPPRPAVSFPSAQLKCSKQIYIRISFAVYLSPEGEHSL